jgi:hypothetical protein
MFGHEPAEDQRSAVEEEESAGELRELRRAIDPEQR